MNVKFLIGEAFVTLAIMTTIGVTLEDYGGSGNIGKTTSSTTAARSAADTGAGGTESALSTLTSVFSSGLKMSQPENLGAFYLDPVGSVDFMPVSGATELYMDTKLRKRQGIMTGGWAKFGNGDDALYAHYNGLSQRNKGKTVSLGSRDKNNTFVIAADMSTYDIYKIATNDGITFYAIRQFGDSQSDWWILGCLAGGNFVKYIDTNELTDQYNPFPPGANTTKRNFFYYGSTTRSESIPFGVKGDTIIMDCFLGNGPMSPKAGQMRFKWNKQNQRFDVDYVK